MLFKTFFFNLFFFFFFFLVLKDFKRVLNVCVCSCGSIGFSVVQDSGEAFQDLPRTGLQVSVTCPYVHTRDGIATYFTCVFTEELMSS